MCGLIFHIYLPCVLDNRRSETRKVNSKNEEYDQRGDFIDKPGIVRDVSGEKIGANI